MESTSYIKSIPQEYHQGIRREVFNGIRKGKSIDEIAGALDDVYGKAAGRTRTIAMDQTGNLRGAITKAQHESLGLKKFEWIAVLDGRTRPRHQTFAGQTYTWKNGAGGEYPGSAINCRCTAATVKQEVQNVMQGKEIPEPEATRFVEPPHQRPGLTSIADEEEWLYQNFGHKTLEKKKWMFRHGKNVSDDAYLNALQNYSDELYRLKKKYPELADKMNLRTIEISAKIEGHPNATGLYTNSIQKKITLQAGKEWDDVAKNMVGQHKRWQANPTPVPSIHSSNMRWADDAEGAFKGVARHETAHRLHTSAKVQRGWDEAVDAAKKRFQKEGFEYNYNSWDDAVKHRVSKYGNTNRSEMFSEAFAMYTEPGYGGDHPKQRLPTEMEDFIKNLLMGAL